MLRVLERENEGKINLYLYSTEVIRIKNVDSKLILKKGEK